MPALPPRAPVHIPPAPQSARARQADTNRLAAQAYLYGYRDTGFRPQLGKRNIGKGNERAISLLDYWPTPLLLSLRPEAAARLLQTPSFARERTGYQGLYHPDMGEIEIDPTRLMVGANAPIHEGLHALEGSRYTTLSPYSSTGLMPGAPSQALYNAASPPWRQMMGRSYWGNTPGMEDAPLPVAEYFPMTLQNSRWLLDQLIEADRQVYNPWFSRTPRERPRRR